MKIKVSFELEVPDENVEYYNGTVMRKTIERIGSNLGYLIPNHIGEQWIGKHINIRVDRADFKVGELRFYEV
jgi:hypothetical protein